MRKCLVVPLKCTAFVDEADTTGRFLCVLVCVPQDAGGADLPGPRLRDQRHPAEERRETRHGAVGHCRLQEEVPHCESDGGSLQQQQQQRSSGRGGLTRSATLCPPRRR